jgi:hypothetical protein
MKISIGPSLFRADAHFTSRSSLDTGIFNSMIIVIRYFIEAGCSSQIIVYVRTPRYFKVHNCLH